MGCADVARLPGALHFRRQDLPTEASWNRLFLYDRQCQGCDVRERQPDDLGPEYPAGTGNGDHVAITLTDTGSDMTSEMLTHAFEPSFTTKESGSGTALDLSAVHASAAQSGGTATIES